MSGRLVGWSEHACIDQQDIKNSLAPIWLTKADTARKAMNRLGIVMRHAAAMGVDVDIQATDKTKGVLDGVKLGLGDFGIVTTISHNSKLPSQGISAVTPFVSADDGVYSFTSFRPARRPYHGICRAHVA